MWIREKRIGFSLRTDALIARNYLPLVCRGPSTNQIACQSANPPSEDYLLLFVGRREPPVETVGEESVW